MKKSLKRPGWTRSKPFRNFMAGCLASSLAVPLFVLADPSSDAPADRGPATDESSAVTDSPESLPAEEVAEEVIEEVTGSEPEPTLEEQREEYLTELGEQEYTCSGDIERARRDVKAHRDLFKDADQFAEVLTALDEEELKIYARKVEEAESLEDLSDLVEDLDEFADDRCELIKKEKRGRSSSSRYAGRSSRSGSNSTLSGSRERARELEKQLPHIANFFRVTALKQLRAARIENQELARNDQAMGLAPLSFGGDRDPFELARETLGRAQGIRCLDDGSKARLSGYQRDLSIMACEDLASNGSAAGWAVASCVQNLKIGLAQDLQQAALLSNGGSMEQMNTVSNALARVNAIPGKMQQVDQERQKIQQQQLQQLQQTQQLMHQVLSGGSSAAAATPPGSIPGTAQASGGVFSMGSYGGSSSSVVPPLPGTTPLPTQ